MMWSSEHTRKKSKQNFIIHEIAQKTLQKATDPNSKSNKARSQKEGVP